MVKQCVLILLVALCLGVCTQSVRAESPVVDNAGLAAFYGGAAAGQTNNAFAKLGASNMENCLSAMINNCWGEVAEAAYTAYVCFTLAYDETGSWYAAVAAEYAFEVYKYLTPP